MTVQTTNSGNNKIYFMGWVSTTKFNGMFSLRRATELPVGFCSDSLNGDLGSSSVAAPEKGYSLFGKQANPNDKIVRQFTFTKGDGTEILLHTRDNGTNFIVEYLNPEDIRNSVDGEWSILEAGLSRSYTLKDGSTAITKFDFTSFNDTGTDQLIYGNGVEAMRVWNGATGEISSTTVNTIVLTGTATLAQRGFAASGSVIINGTSYTYGSIASQTFSGVTTDPSGEANGSGVAQTVNTSTLSAADRGSILMTAHGRLYLAGIHATPNQVTFSAVSDIATYNNSGNPADGGFEDFPQLNGKITGLSFLDDWIIVFSENGIVAFKFDFPSSTTRIAIRKDIANEGAVSHKGIRKIGDQIFYITPKGGIKRLTQVAAQQVLNVEDLSETIRPTIENYTWDDAVLEYLTQKRVVLAAGKSSDDVDDNDRMVALYFSLNEVGEKSLNLGIVDWTIGDACIYGGNMHFGGSLDSRNFKAFDGYSKNGAPYIWKRTERIEFFENFWEKKWVKLLAVRGTIGAGTILYLTLKYNLNGVINKQEMKLRYDDSQYVVQQALNTLGGFELGSNPLGGTIEAVSDMFPFKVKFELPHIYAEDFQLEFKTDGAGQKVSIDSYGMDVYSAEQHDTQDEIKELGL